jgi:hypothetical protein
MCVVQSYKDALREKKEPEEDMDKDMEKMM